MEISTTIRKMDKIFEIIEKIKFDLKEKWLNRVR